MGTKAMLYFNLGQFRLPVYSHYDGFPNGVPMWLAEHLEKNPEVLQEFGKFMEELARLKAGFPSYVEFVNSHKNFIDTTISEIFKEDGHPSIYFDMNPPSFIEFDYEYIFTKVDDQFNLTVNPYKHNNSKYTMTEYIKKFTNWRPTY